MKNSEIYNIQNQHLKKKFNGLTHTGSLARLKSKSFYDHKNKSISQNDQKQQTENDLLKEKLQKQQTKNKLLNQFIMQFHHQQFQPTKYNNIMDFVQEKLECKSKSQTFHNHKSQYQASNQYIMEIIDQLINNKQIDNAYILKQYIEVQIKKYDSLENQNQKLLNQFHNHQQKIKNNVIQINNQNKMIQQFQDNSQYADKSKILSDKNNQIKILNDQLKKKQDQIENLQSDITQIEVQKDDYCQQVQNLQTFKEKSSNYETIMADNKITMSNLQKQIEKLQEQLEENAQIKYADEIGSLKDQNNKNEKLIRIQTKNTKFKQDEMIKIKKVHSYELIHIHYYLRHKLKQNQVQFKEINQYLFNSNQSVCTIEQIYIKIQQEPFKIKNQEDALLFARYLVEEDQNDDHYFLNMNLVQNVNVVESIMKFFIKKYTIRSHEELYDTLIFLSNLLLENKSNHEKDIHKYNKQNDLCPISLMIKVFDYPTEQKDIIFDWIFSNIKNQTYISLFQFWNFWSKFYLQFRNNKQAYLETQNIFSLQNN